MRSKFDSDPRSAGDTAKHTIPQLLAHSRDFMHLEKLLKQRLKQIPEHAYRVACLRNTELSLFCTDSIWLGRLRLLQPDILQICRQLNTEQLLTERVLSIKTRVKPDPAERFV